MIAGSIYHDTHHRYCLYYMVCLVVQVVHTPQHMPHADKKLLLSVNKLISRLFGAS